MSETAVGDRETSTSHFRYCDFVYAAASEVEMVVSRGDHVELVLTLDTYSHVLPDMQKAAAERIETLLFRDAG